MKRKNSMVEVKFVTESGKEFCTCTFKKEEWQKIEEAAINEFILSALDNYITKQKETKNVKS